MMTMMEQASMKDKKPKQRQDDLKLSTVEEAASEFVGEVDNLHKIDTNSLFDDNYRINVWTRYLNEGGLSYSYEIKHSYFMSFKDGKLTDLTRPPKERPLGNFFS